MTTKWSLTLNNLSLGGYAPLYWLGTYPSFGNKNQAAEMVSCDLVNPSYLTQGKGLAVISGTVDQLMKGILDTVVSADKTYGFGGTTLYEITPTAVTSVRVITGASGEDVALYNGHLKYVYDTDIGDFDLGTTFDDDWWTTVAGGSALTAGVPHQAIVAGTGGGILSILNGSVVANWDGSTATNVAFNTKDTDIVLVSQAYNRNRFWFAGNKPNASGRNQGFIFVWDGGSPSWNYKIDVDGKIGTLFVKNGITFVFYQKNLSQGVCTLGYCDGEQIRDVANYKGSLPSFYQVTNYQDFIIWASGTDVFAWGGGDLKVNTRIFKLATCGTGGLANPFGEPITAFADKLEKLTGYTTTSSWKSLLFDITQGKRRSMIDEIQFNFEKLATGARVDFTLRDNKGVALYSDYISTVDATSATFYPKCLAENFRIELDFSNGSATNNVAIRQIKVSGHTI